MRTTIRLDPQVLAEAKQVAAQTNRSLTAVIEEAVRESLARRQQMREREPIHLTTIDGHGLMPGVDLDSSAALLDLMDGDHDAR